MGIKHKLNWIKRKYVYQARESTDDDWEADEQVIWGLSEARLMQVIFLNCEVYGYSELDLFRTWINDKIE